MEGRKIFFQIILEIPLLILLFFSVKSLIFHIRKIKVIGDTDTGLIKEHTRLLLLLLAILLIVILIVVLIILPLMALFITFMVVFTTIVGFCYGFVGLFYGLAKVKEAGGSPAKVLITLSTYLREYFNINNPKKPPKKDLLRTNNKDAHTKLDNQP